ncbi:uncharacterized protein LOC111441474 [Cucurbita moschata]|uniref:Uncharacterized protein LOC111441474 n=1 Tax=Cucurbita moschata TaxID=3662 RepID=A0A6J1F273_CUCMO|nr:uncharacterized protein LOC111441474 [Cucurbita moschata]
MPNRTSLPLFFTSTFGDPLSSTAGLPLFLKPPLSSSFHAPKMDRLIAVEPSTLIPIPIEPSRKCSAELTLRNVMYTMPVAFRLQPLIKSRYTFKPQSGIIPPLATLTVEILYHLPPGSDLPDSFPYSDDSFLLHSVVVPGAVISFDSVPSDWFTTRKKQVFIDSGIKVMFVGSAVVTRLVAEGVMDQIRDVLERSDPSWRAVDAVDEQGRTLLHLAVEQGRADLVQLLLEFNPDMGAVGRCGMTALEAAAAAGQALIVELLLARRASTERGDGSVFGAVHLAAAGGHVEVLRLLLVKGAFVDALSKDGDTALHLAVQERRRDCARLLLANGAKPDVRSAEQGDTALHMAARIGDEQIVKLLIQKGANKDIRNWAGKRPYDVAFDHSHTRLFDVLRLADKLATAARKGDVRSIQLLLDSGAALNGRDQNGWTALHRAAFKGHTDAARALIDIGIDIHAKDDDGYTALHCAVEAAQADAVQLLVERGADVEAQTNKGMSSMQIAESLQYPRIMRILMKGGAGRDKEASPSQTPSWGLTKKKQQSKSRGRIRSVRSTEFDKSVALSVV